MARKHNPYRCSDGSLVDGLAKLPDGRWYVPTAKKTFRAPTEAAAVAKFRKLTGDDKTGLDEFVNEAGETTDEGVARFSGGVRFNSYKQMWVYVANEIRKRPQWVAEQTGIEQIGYLFDLKTPQPQPSLAELISTYEAVSTADPKAKAETVSTFKAFAQAIGMTKLSDIDVAKVKEWRDTIKGGYSGSTVNAYFSRVRNVIRFGLKDGLDAVSINKALDKLKVLTHVTVTPNNPQPITREDFHKLLDASAKSDAAKVWRFILLMGLNGAYYMEDICAMKWEHIKGDAVISRRKKTGNCLRVCTLWEETKAALAELPRKSEWILTSKTGTRYNKNTKVNDFKDLAEKAGVKVEFNNLRDGTYTVAAQAKGIEEKYAKLIAGHSNGMADKYVLANPQCVREACEAVRAFYLL